MVAAAVILTPDGERELQEIGVTDSKALTSIRRQELAQQIRDIALTWGLGWVHPRDIDRINILQATFLAMHRALSRLVPAPDHCLVDGNKTIPSVRLPQTPLVKADSKSIAIARPAFWQKFTAIGGSLPCQSAIPDMLWNPIKATVAPFTVRR